MGPSTPCETSRSMGFKVHSGWRRRTSRQVFWIEPWTVPAPLSGPPTNTTRSSIKVPSTSSRARVIDECRTGSESSVKIGVELILAGYTAHVGDHRRR